MTAPIRPDGVSAFANEKWIFVKTIANKLAPTATEINHATAFDLTGVLYAEQFEGPTAESSRVTEPRRVMDSTVTQRSGITTYSISDLFYAIQPQAAAASDGKKAYEALDNGTTGYVVHVPGVEPDHTVVADDFVVVIPVVTQEGVLVKTSNGEEAQYAIRQPVDVTGSIATLVEVA